ncbi:fdc50abf-2a68-46c5-8b87-1a0194e635ee [Thermothielavioides terrestris]|uniref:Mediator of RNA polymerase II transcription subunit 14 n=1 Tax=Thermothielavioides terrestris TaxID=2587410 RepID=A0A3S4ESX7_9PEZI|nr:fdc50abf-2a68-46c5-8b87-1a0194e635ee [Thermothielavioides terrestris]
MADSGPQGAASDKVEGLPDELRHITTDILPLSLLLTRLAEYSHAKLQEIITELAAKPLPQALANGNVNGTANGNGILHNVPIEDTSPESLDKKTMLLNFTKDLHSRWVKALVITEWSRNAEEVGKLIDIRTYLAEKLELYHKTFWNLVQVKREMLFARVPSPDLKTALEVLSNGAVHWMPDFGYLEPPPLTEEEKLHWTHEIEMHLHARLQLQEFDTMPDPFKKYRIGNGKVTFTVPGEFEVDLTIGHEDFSTQFWFLDFRPIYSPAPPELSQQLRQIIEARVNNALAADGLTGCYKYLHEFTLTAKITEFTRQALELSSTGRWADTLRVERLNRALGIQYWRNCQHSRVSQSWILLGVRSAEGPNEDPDAQASSSRLMLSWFRDGKEVKEVGIAFDVDTISTEDLLMAVIAKHIEHLLCPIYQTLVAKPRYAQRQGRLSLNIEKDPQRSRLTPAPFDEVKSMVYSLSPSIREAFHAVWVRNAKWGPQWFAALSMSLAGDHCWLVEISVEGQGSSGRRINTFRRLPSSPSDLLLPDMLFQKLAKYGPGIMAEIQSLRHGRQEHVAHAAQQQPANSSSSAASYQTNMLIIVARASELLPPSRIGSLDGTRPLWAQEYIPVTYKGLAPEPPPAIGSGDPLQRQAGPLRILVEARVAVTNRARFEFVKSRLDRDVRYDPRIGQFTLRFRPEANTSVIPMLRERIQALDRLFDFVEAVHRAGKHAVLESVTLHELVFTYGAHTAEAPPPPANSQDQGEQRSWKVRLNLSGARGVDVRLEQGNPHLRVIDYLRSIANSPKSKSLPAWLSLTLPLFRALERLQDSWDLPSANKQGECFILHKSLDWVALRFALAGPKSRRLQLDIKARERKGQLMWQVSRPSTDANANNENDEFTKVLAPKVWSVSGQGFQGLSTGAAANWDQGIENLLALISDTLLSMVGTPPQPQQQQAPPAGQAQEQLPAPPPGPAGRFPQQVQPSQQPLQHLQHLQQQQQHHRPPPPPPQQHVPQPGMHGQAQHQGQVQGPRAGMGQNNASVVVID